MFQLLKAVRFYSEGVVREKLRDAMTVVRRGTVELRREGGRHRGDIFVTRLGGIAKSSTHYARMFCKENRIILRNAPKVLLCFSRLVRTIHCRSYPAFLIVGRTEGRNPLPELRKRK